jgi:hypothetical protein
MVSPASVSRRGALRATAAGVVAAASTSGNFTAQAQASNKITYVLVPPAWHGGWCWKELKPLLQARGRGGALRRPFGLEPFIICHL